MKTKVFFAAVAAGLVTMAFLPQSRAAAEDENFPETAAHAENGEESLEDVAKAPIIVYGLDDERFQAALEKNGGNGIVHDLNDPYTSEESNEEEDRSVLVFRAGEEMPGAGEYCPGKTNELYEIPDGENAVPEVYCNLGWKCSYGYCFSDVRLAVTGVYVDPDVEGYLFLSCSGIENPVRISMIEYETGRVVNQWEGNPEEVSGVAFPGKVSKFYYFKFESCDGEPISGTGEIFWGNY